jgi:hypothetical protein
MTVSTTEVKQRRMGQADDEWQASEILKDCCGLLQGCVAEFSQRLKKIAKNTN